MKVTKRILRELVESEINELQISEAGGWTGTRVEKATDLTHQYTGMDASARDTSAGRALKAKLGRIATEFEGKEWFKSDTKANIAGEIRTALASDASAGEPEEVPAQASSGRRRSSGLLKLGSSGPEVTKLQNLLNERLVAHGKGDLKVAVTGEFDQTTDTAVRTMQGIYKITVDGIVGPATWAALKGDKTKLGDIVPGGKPGVDPNKRPEKPGPMFTWDSQKNIWYLYCNHYYYNVDPNDPIYQLWIVKDGEDFHVKMNSGDTWANVSQSDIDNLETAASSAVTVVDPAAGLSNLALPESYSLSKVMLLEFNATPSATGKSPNQLDTKRDEACTGEPILTLEDQGEAISKRIHTFKNELTKHANAMAEEGNKSFWQNSDEERGMAALAGFDQLSTELYDDLADKIKAYIVAGGTTNFSETPTMMLAVKTGWQTVDEVQEKLDSFLASEERATMLRIVQRNNFPLQQKSREVVVSTKQGADQEAIAAVNKDLEELMSVIEFTAVVIGSNSYDTRTTAGGVGRMAGSALSIASFFIPGYGQAALAGNLAKAGLTGAATATRVAKGAAAAKAVVAARAAGASKKAAAAAGVAAKAAATATKTARVGGALGGAGKLVPGVTGGRTAALAGAAAGGLSIGGMFATAIGLDTFGDNSDEDKVMIAINAWDKAATKFYIDNSQRIIENELVIETPTELLFTAYNQNVTSDDSAATVDEMIDEMDEFLGGGNYSIMKTQIERNNSPYSQHARQNQNESFTFDRFSKLAGLLKG
jgi:peptidoglycan hydrolase-like protein with peptidoglycan-binding domain